MGKVLETGCAGGRKSILEDRCVMCGCPVPEGRMACLVCSGELKGREEDRRISRLLLDMSRLTEKRISMQEYGTDV